MRKILTITAIALSTSSGFAGGDNELKNFRFGLKATPSVNWAKPEGKIIAANGAGVKIGGGIILEFRLASVISVQTGAQIDLDGGKIKYNNGELNNPGANTVSYYYNNADDKIEKFRSDLANDPTAYTHYQLNERQYKVTYITVPLALKMKTKEIASFVYYGQVGLHSSFRWKATADDQLNVINDNAVPTISGVSTSKSKVDITKDINLFSASLNFGLGAEMNLSGSTSFTFGLNYNLGFTNAVKGASDYLERRTNMASGTPSYSHMPQTIKSNAVVLTVGILF